MNKYAKMYGWLHEAFGNDKFGIDEFRATFPSTQHAKVIHDLIGLGYLERRERGEYKVVAPERFVHGIVESNLQQEDVLKYAERKYAYCCNDAVVIWTEGYYWTGFTKGFKPIHVKVLQKDLRYWKTFFKKHDVDFALENEKKTLFGLTYILHSAESLKIEMKDDMPVVPLKETIYFCKKNELTYRPALEYLDREYGLKIYEEFEHL
jgi:hypothetical protein